MDSFVEPSEKRPVNIVFEKPNILWCLQQQWCTDTIFWEICHKIQAYYSQHYYQFLHQCHTAQLLNERFFLRVVHGFQNITVLFFYFLQPVYYQQRLLPLYNASFLFSKINIQWVIGKKTVPTDLSHLFQTALLY